VRLNYVPDLPALRDRIDSGVPGFCRSTCCYPKLWVRWRVLLIPKNKRTQHSTMENITHRGPEWAAFVIQRKWRDACAKWDEEQLTNRAAQFIQQQWRRVAETRKARDLKRKLENRRIHTNSRFADEPIGTMRAKPRVDGSTEQLDNLCDVTSDLNADLDQEIVRLRKMNHKR